MASGTVRFVIPGGSRGPVAFSPDGKFLAAGAPDATILLWDLTPPKGAAKWAANEADALWAGLAVVDARRGFEHMTRLLAHPDEAIELIRTRIKVADARLDISQLVRQLDDPRLAVRDTASREIGQLGEPAAEAMKKVLEGNPSPEVRRRLEFLLNDLTTNSHLASIRPSRVIEILERVGTPAAIMLLDSFAKSPEDTVFTREAKSAIERSKLSKK